MMKYLAILILVCSCSSNKVKDVATITNKTIAPDWVYSPSRGCKSYELCATGEGVSTVESDANARKSLASIFSSEISSNLQLSKYSFSKESISQMSESISESVNEKVEVVLKGSSISARFEREEAFFSLIKLDKRKTGRILEAELRKIDKEISRLMKLRNRIYLKKLNVLFTEREILNEKLIVLKGTDKRSRYDLDKINNLKFDRSKSNKIFILNPGNIPQHLFNKITETFSDIGYKFVKRANATYIIKLDFKLKEEYINVKGFKKFSMELQGQATKYDNKIGNFVLKHVQTGRSQKDAILRSKDRIIKDFEANMQKLEMN